MRVAAYALGTKPVDMIPDDCRAAYHATRLKLDLELT